MGPTFGKRLKILEFMIRVKSYDIMLYLECNDLILQMFQCIFNIKEYYPNNVKTNMQTIVFSYGRS